MIVQDLSARSIATELLRDKADSNVIDYSKLSEISTETGVELNELVGMAREINMDVTGVPGGRPKLTLKGAAAKEAPRKSNPKVSDLVVEQVKNAKIFGLIDTGDKPSDDDFIFARLGAFKKERKAIVDAIAGYEEQARLDRARIKELEQQLAQAKRGSPKRSGGSVSDKLPTEAQIKHRGADAFFRKLS